MKSIATLEGAAFLRQINKIRKEAATLLKESGVLEIRKRMPALTGEETEAEKNAKIEAQGKANLDAMLDRLLEEKPEETCKLLSLLSVPEDGDPENPTGLDMIMVGVDILATPKVLDFLLSLMKLAQTDTGG